MLSIKPYQHEDMLEASSQQSRPCTCWISHESLESYPGDLHKEPQSSFQCFCSYPYTACKAPIVKVKTFLCFRIYYIKNDVFTVVTLEPAISCFELLLPFWNCCFRNLNEDGVGYFL